MQIDPQNNVSFIKSLFESGEGSEGFQQKIADFYPGIIYIYDADQKKIRFVNKRVTDLLGYSDDDILQDNDLLKYVFEDDVPLVQEELDKFNSLPDNDTYSYNSRLIHKKGSWKYFRTQGTVLRRNDKGSPESLLLIAQDLTEQLQTEEEAKAATALLNETEKLLQFGTWTWDVIKNRFEWSTGMYELLGYSEHQIPLADLSMKTFMEHMKSEEAEELETAVQQAYDTKSGFEKTFTVLTRNNNEKIVTIRGKVITSSSNGNVTKIIGVTHDITEERLLSREQQRLKESLAEYKQFMIEKERRLDFGSLELDMKTGKLHWSDGMYLLFGYDPATDKPRINLDSDVYSPHMTQADLLEARTKLQEALKHSENYSIETAIKTKQGVDKRLETYGKIERDADGKPIKIVGITRDITRLKDYEKNLQQKIEELNRSNKELEEFAYIASHDLQEPLRKITAFSERLQERAASDLSQDAQIYLQRILAATQNMRMLIDNLLDFSRTSRHNDTLEKVDLNAVLKEVMTDLELKIEETGAVIRHSPLPSITSYHSQMKQLFSNLLTNAIKFRKPGQPPVIDISSKLASEQERSKHLLNGELKYYTIVVQDDGIGFEQEYALKIFQIFQRLHGKAEYPGSGIGLAICKKIVENHHGVIYAESNPGSGAVFSIILPETQ